MKITFNALTGQFIATFGPHMLAAKEKRDLFKKMLNDVEVGSFGNLTRQEHKTFVRLLDKFCSWS